MGPRCYETKKGDRCRSPRRLSVLLELEPSPSYQLQDKHDDRDDKQNMYKAAEALTGKAEPQGPQNQKY
jgi:hypothetical protein